MTLSPQRIQELESTACRLRRSVIDMLYEAQSDHPGGSLSCVAILTVLFWHQLRLTAQLNYPDRDRFVLSKGYACPALYAVLLSLVTYQQ